MSQTSYPLYILLAIAGIVLIAVIIYLITSNFTFRKVKQGQAMIRTGRGTTKVAFGGMYVTPFIHQVEYIDMTMKKIPLVFSSENPLIFKDEEKASLEASVLVRVNATVEDVMHISMALSPKATFSLERVTDLLQDLFLESVKQVAFEAKLSDYLYNYEAMKSAIMNKLGDNVHGFVIDSLIIRNLSTIS